MVKRMGELLAQRASENFVGRAEEMAALLEMLGEGGPLVTQMHGIAGVGKSALLEAFSSRARAQGATVVRLDCRLIEPTPRGFVYELASAIGSSARGVEEVSERLGSLGSRVVLALDTYEVFWLMDTWLRQAFIPALGDNVRLVLAGRQPPIPAWLASPEWRGLFRSISLGPLSDGEALELLGRAGIGRPEAQRINRFARGHPLALNLAASAATERHDIRLETAAVQSVVRELTKLYLADVSDPLTRRGLEAASVVRRVTKSLLGAILPDAAPQDVYDRLQALPFVETGRDGLVLHEAVQEAIATSLKASDPVKYRDYRRAAWRQIRAEARTAGTPELWRYTADMFYILGNPVLREAFFPSGAQDVAVEPARPDDGPHIHAIIDRHEGPEAGKWLKFWWENLPQSFKVMRDRSNEVVGFDIHFDPTTVAPSLLEQDPITMAWWRHLNDAPVPRNQKCDFFRRWLSRDEGEAPSSVQGASWLDIKRHYMEIRPAIRRVYITVCDIEIYAPAALQLKFQPLPQANVELDGVVYHSAFNDLGPASIDGWLAGLVASELGIVEKDDILDVDARELVLNGSRTPLTKLEFELMHYLY
ncbi:MAG: ATP-binding protein, partial [Chloroflexi bacterium]|nr:ATP-binding protein [Chloroflexota bacterium]